MPRILRFALDPAALLMIVSVGTAEAAPTLVQNPALPAAIASFTATLDGSVVTPPFGPGEVASAGPTAVFVPIDGTTTLRSSASASNAFTSFAVPKVSSEAEAAVTSRTSSGSAVTHVREARTLMSYSIRIVPIGPIPNPPSMIPVIFAGQLSTMADDFGEFGHTRVQVFTPPVGTRFSITHSSSNVPPSRAFSETRNIAVNVLHQVDLEAFTEAFVQNASSVEPAVRIAAASAEVGFAFDQAQFDSNRMLGGLPSFDLESAYVIEIGPLILVSGEPPPQAVPTGGAWGRLLLGFALAALGARAGRVRWRPIEPEGVA